MAVVLAMLLASCGSSSGSGSGEQPETLDDVFAALEGLEGEERWERLLELARAEESSGPLVPSASLSDADVWSELFAERTDLTVEHVRLSNVDTMQRLAQEAEANYQDGFDVVMIGTSYLSYLQETHDIFYPYDTPAASVIPDDVVFPAWVGVYYSIGGATWHRDAEAPESWEDMIVNHADRHVFDANALPRFATLVLDYFMDELGMTQEEAFDLFRESARQAGGVRGSQLASQLIMAGEYDYTSAAFVGRTMIYQEEGAPLEWEPAIEPLIRRTQGIAIQRTTDRPATALAYVEFFLSDELQQLAADMNQVPASTNLAVPHPVQQYRMIEERDENDPELADWDRLFQEVVIDNIGGPIVTD